MIYACSRASVPARVKMWRDLRDQGISFSSSWIDDQDDALLSDGPNFWEKCIKEVLSSSRLILYVEENDFPLKGSLVEIGAALSNDIPVYVVAKDIVVDQETFRPLGSWITHPLVKLVSSLEEAISA